MLGRFVLRLASNTPKNTSLGTVPNAETTLEVLIQPAIDGAGLAFTLEEHVSAHLESGGLIRVLEDWCPPFAGYFLYYPGRRQQAPALSALIETLRL